MAINTHKRDTVKAGIRLSSPRMNHNANEGRKLSPHKMPERGFPPFTRRIRGSVNSCRRT